MIDWETLPFAGDPLIGERLKFYRDAFGISICIETGTQVGHTTRVLSYIFKRIISIEISEQAYRLAVENLWDRKNVELVHASSEVALPGILLNVASEASVCFFLDAHGCGYGCPLRAELDAIARLRSSKPDVIAIHDFAVPDQPSLGFDIYDERPIDLALVGDRMDEIWPEGWSARFNDVALGAMRGCAFFTKRV